MLKKTALFLLINFGGLAIGGLLMGEGPSSDWYLNLNKAPWTPPGYIFGLAWTLIMICFSIYLGKLFVEKPDHKITILFLISLFLNVSWNYIFFNQHLTDTGLVSIISLTVVTFIFFLRYKTPPMDKYRWLLLPYMSWLMIATSLNAYISLYN